MSMSCQKKIDFLLQFFCVCINKTDKFMLKIYFKLKLMSGSNDEVILLVLT